MPTPTPEGDDLLEGVYQEVTPVIPQEAKKSYKPWHKPRKHHIRINLWCAAIRKLIEADGLADGHVLKYLGMPGEDFLDLRTLDGVCQRAKIKVRYLGLDSSAGTEEFETNLSNHEISYLEYVYEHSYLLKGRIEDLANKKSHTYEKAASFRTFDVVNIDLCDSIAGVSNKAYFEALYNLCLQQQAGRTKPWLLFLATRVGREHFDGTVKKQLFQCVVQNIDKHTAFDGSLKSTLKLDKAAVEADLDTSSPLAHWPLVQLFTLSLGKWLLDTMLRAEPRVKVQLLESFCYRVSDGEPGVSDDLPDMVSLAFLFEPNISPPVEKAGVVAKSADALPNLSESDLAQAFIPVVATLQDVDKLLHENPELFKKAKEKTAKVLATARYDTSTYDAWLEGVTWKPQAPNQLAQGAKSGGSEQPA
jgi:hypothetical protein